MATLLTPDMFSTQPWKNGGGTTHEIAKSEDAQGLIWRLSIAEVSSDGPFSRFDRLSRVLTVIAGAGLVLHSPDGPLAAKPLQPLAFSGDTPIDSRMVNGPIRDFNLIYDATRVAGEVTVLRGPVAQDFAGGPLVVLALEGRITVDGMPISPGSVALQAGGRVAVQAAPDAVMLIVRLTPR